METMVRGYKDMKVEDLKNICRGYGLQLQKAGKKLKKDELIAQIEEHEKKKYGVSKKESQATAEVEEREMDVKWDEEGWLPADREEIRFAETIDQMKSRYKYRRADSFYSNCLKPGSTVVYIQPIITRSGKEVEKLRMAKVTGILRDKEKVRVLTAIKTEEFMTYDDLLYVLEPGRRRIPKDIKVYLKKQRNKEV